MEKKKHLKKYDNIYWMYLNKDDLGYPNTSIFYNSDTKFFTYRKINTDDFDVNNKKLEKNNILTHLTDCIICTYRVDSNNKFEEIDLISSDTRNNFYSDIKEIYIEGEKEKIISSFPTKYTIPSNKDFHVLYRFNSEITSIGSYAFLNCSKLIKTIIPITTKSIGFWSFKNTGLISIDIPESVINITESFVNSNLKEVILHEGLKTISIFSFSGSNITSITLPKSLNTLGLECFWNCHNLREVKLLSDNMVIISPFTSCESLPVIDGIRYADTAAVKLIENLEHVVIKQGTVYLADNFFYSNNNVKIIELPDTIRFCVPGIFFNEYNIINLEKIIIHSLNPFKMYVSKSLSFSGFNEKTKIYVPDISLELYKSTDIWSNYSDKIFPISDLNIEA